MPSRITNQTGDGTPVVFVAAEASRNPRSWHAIPTPEAWFSDPKRMLKVADNLAGKFCRNARNISREDMASDAILKMYALAETWSAAKGKPFGGYVISSLELWLIGRMYTYMVQLSGATASRAVCASVRQVYLDAPAGLDGDGNTSTVGETMDVSDARGMDCTPEGDADRRDILKRLRAVMGHYPAAVVDLIVAHLNGEDVTPAECPEGWTPTGIAKAAATVQNTLRASEGMGPVAPRPEEAPRASADGWW